MMCHLDKTSCSHYNIAVLGRGAAAAQKRILRWTRGLRRQRPKNAFWGGRSVCGGGGPKRILAASRIVINTDSAGDFPHPPLPSPRLPVPPAPPLLRQRILPAPRASL